MGKLAVEGAQFENAMDFRGADGRRRCPVLGKHVGFSLPEHMGQRSMGRESALKLEHGGVIVQAELGENFLCLLKKDMRLENFFFPSLGLAKHFP